MPPVKRCASRSLSEYGEAQSELIGKTVIPYRRKGGHGRERLAGRIARVSDFDQRSYWKMAGLNR